MTPDPRIRWEPNKYGGFTGHVGTVDTWLFQIHRPVLAGQGWVLTAAFPGALNDVRPGTPDELKAEAERWLSGFVASLGAAFPEGECPECGFRPPTHTHDKNCSRYAPDTAATAGEAQPDEASGA